jgi:hypothetical protein
MAGCDRTCILELYNLSQTIEVVVRACRLRRHLHMIAFTRGLRICK